MRRALIGSLAALAAWSAWPSPAGAKGLPLEGAVANGVTFAGSPYRYAALSPAAGDVTVVVRTDRRGGGRIDRWWYLRGTWFIPAAAYDGSSGALSADGGTLVLRRFFTAYPPRQTRLAVLDTDVHLRHPRRPGEDRPVHAISRIAVPGDLQFVAISPHGSTVYLREYGNGCCGPGASHTRFQIRSLDLAEKRRIPHLMPTPIANDNAPLEPMRGLPVSWATSADGRRVYTLYSGDERAARGGTPFIQVLDTGAGTGFRLDLPGLERRHNLFLLELRLEDGDRTLAMLARSPRQGGPRRRVMEIDTTGLRSEEPIATTSGGGGWLAFARTPRRPGNLLERVGTIGYSSEGRPIHLRQVGDPAIDGRLLVFGCIHGDECGVAGHVEPLANGCPDPGVNAFVVPNLNPDGTAAGSRLNADGVDLNRNFPSHWRAGGSPGDPEYPGPRPFSEPESRLAARLIRAIGPGATIWFHEYRADRPLVRAWGPSRAAARRFAQLAGMPFRAIPWPAGTAPNWQNHHFPGSPSFVVELPRGQAGERIAESRLDRAVDLIAREVAED